MPLLEILDPKTPIQQMFPSESFTRTVSRQLLCGQNRDANVKA
jgi:hypothetical protein